MYGITNPREMRYENRNIEMSYFGAQIQLQGSFDCRGVARAELEKTTTNQLLYSLWNY